MIAPMLSRSLLLAAIMLCATDAFLAPSPALLGRQPASALTSLRKAGRVSGWSRSKVRMSAATESEEEVGSDSGLLPRERYMVFNRFQTREGKGPKFEKRWAERKSSLKTLQGFRYFCLLRLSQSYTKRDGSKMSYPEGTPDYMSMTVWETKKDFNSWRTGYAFKEAHGGGTIGGFLSALVANLGILQGPPAVYLWDGLLPVSVPEADSPLVLKERNAEGKVVADGEKPVPTDAFVAMNRFIVNKGMEADFEKLWKERESKLTDFNGFMGFTLMRRDKPSGNKKQHGNDGSDRPDDVFNYSTITVWRSVEDFEKWRDRSSETHGSTSSFNLMDMVQEPPSPIFWEGTLAVQQSTGL